MEHAGGLTGAASINRANHQRFHFCWEGHCLLCIKSFPAAGTHHTAMGIFVQSDYCQNMRWTCTKQAPRIGTTAAGPAALQRFPTEFSPCPPLPSAITLSCMCHRPRLIRSGAPSQSPHVIQEMHCPHFNLHEACFKRCAASVAASITKCP